MAIRKFIINIIVGYLIMGLVENDKKYIWHPFTQMKAAKAPIPIVKGEGTLLIDEKGNTYIDAISSWWVNLHGHSHPYIAEKVYAQMQKLEHVVFAGFTHNPAVELCDKLSKHLPSNQAKFFFSGDGSSAVEIALKMAVQYWKNKGENKTRFVALDGAYHGETFGAMSAGARSIFSAPFSDLLFECTHIPFPKDEQAAIKSLKTEIDNMYQGYWQSTVGFELKGANLDLTANSYHKISNMETYKDTEEQVLSGYTINLASQLPYTPWAKINWQNYAWENEKASSDSEGNIISLQAYLTPSVQLEFKNDMSDNSGVDDEFASKLTFIYQNSRKKFPPKF
mgnify:CR=1 FL=1